MDMYVRKGIEIKKGIDEDHLKSGVRYTLHVSGDIEEYHEQDMAIPNAIILSLDTGLGKMYLHRDTGSRTAEQDSVLEAIRIMHGVDGEKPW